MDLVILAVSTARKIGLACVVGLILIWILTPGPPALSELRDPTEDTRQRIEVRQGAVLWQLLLGVIAGICLAIEGCRWLFGKM